MPKLQDQAVERNQIHIENAALKVFTRQGFHGTTVRDIAREAKVSLGNIYNYYKTKEALYISLVRRYGNEMAEIQQKTLKPYLGRFDEDGLRALSKAVREIVYRHPDYWRLMYIDVTEFGNRHFAHSFRQLSKNLEELAGGYPDEAKHVRPGVARPTAYAAVYLQFFTYFLVEKLFGGKQHLGLPEEETIEQLIGIIKFGVDAPHPQSNGGSSQRRRK
ncbi:MAG TPA: TetR/AcrR family transcriptional regulator [Terriglobales bacterium]|nr:TetR/AcrR family transcriptional regulator [Terriglobales bacterium]